MNAMKYADLLIDPEWRAVVEDKGVGWITDRYVLLRTDLFARKVTVKNSDHGPDPTAFKVSAVRKLLAEVRTTDLGPIRYVDDQITDAGALLVFLGPGSLTVAVDRVVGGNLLMIADPHLSSTGKVSWWQKRRRQAKPVLVGLQMPKRPADFKVVQTWRLLNPGEKS